MHIKAYIDYLHTMVSMRITRNAGTLHDSLSDSTASGTALPFHCRDSESTTLLFQVIHWFGDSS